MHIVSLNAVTSDGAGNARELPFPVKDHALQIEITGSPSAVTCDLEGSVDGETYFQLGSSTATSDNILFVTGKPVLFARANLTALTGGSSPTVTARYLPHIHQRSLIDRNGKL